MRNPGFLISAVLMVLLSAPTMAQTAITYQGQLQDSNGPFDGTPGMEFRLYDSLEDGNQVGSTIILSAVDVSDGLFQVELDFGDVFDSSPLYLEVEVAGNVLTPRQPVTAVPTAISALNLSSVGLAELDDRYWKQGGNAGTTSAQDFIGTTDAATFILRVHDEEALRIVPARQEGFTGFSPNLIGGHPNNYVDDDGDDDPPVIGAVIGGGGNRSLRNRVSEDFTTVGGGIDNSASGPRATVGGGNVNLASNRFSTVSGGSHNTASGSSATVSGGGNNVAGDSWSTVSGGGDNTASGRFATVPGGRVNQAMGQYSLAGGVGATAGHDGAFVWSDRTFTDADSFSSTGANQFLVQASGGMGLNTNAPDAPLHLAGENNWNLTNTEGDFKIGDATHRFKLGVSLDGGGAGNVRLRAQGGTHNLILGSNESDVVKVNDTAGLDPMVDNNFSLGSSGARWSAVWAADGTINTSDARLKRDVAPLGGALDNIRALRPVTYRWKDRPESGQRLGLIAQEVRQVVPDIVVEPDNEDGALGIRYSELIPVLIAAVKEQDQSVAARFERLEGENAELQRKITAQQRLVETMSEHNRELKQRLAALEAALLEDERVARSK